MAKKDLSEELVKRYTELHPHLMDAYRGLSNIDCLVLAGTVLAETITNICTTNIEFANMQNTLLEFISEQIKSHMPSIKEIQA